MSKYYSTLTPHVQKMWIASVSSNLTLADLLANHQHQEYALQPSECSLAISLLTPVIFAASSLALSWTSVDLLIEIKKTKNISGLSGIPKR
jgi:hypothetical protein